MQTQATKLTVREEFPTSSSDKRYGARVNAIAFNTDFIAKRDPLLVVELLKLHRKAIQLKESSPRASCEEYELAAIQLQGMMSA